MDLGFKMRPHPQFIGWEIPCEFSLGHVQLKALTVDDVDRDFNAIMDNAAELKAANPTMSWPDGLTLEQNLIDVAWHQKEFQSRRSFAWIIEDQNGSYLGCLYVYPSIAGENAADVYWWWRSGTSIDTIAFQRDLLHWLSSDDWPELDFRLK